MNRIQKTAWMTVICAGTGFLLSIIAVTILYFKTGFPRAWAGLAFMALTGLAGFAPLIFRKDHSSVQMDERDQLIKIRSATAGFTASYLVFGSLAMGIWFFHGQDKLINVNTLPQIWMTAGITAFFIQSLTTLILYGKDNQKIKGGVL